MVGSISHELRTPLNCLLSLLKSTEEVVDKSSKIYQNYILPSIHSSNFILHLVNDILAYT